MSNAAVDISATTRREVKVLVTKARELVGARCAFSSPKKQGSRWVVKVEGPEKLIWEVKKAAK